MPIFEERESLGVKTLKSFADIKKRVGDVCHSETWQIKFIDGLESHFSIKTVTSLWSIMGYLNEKVGLVQLCKLPFSSVVSTEA